MAEVLDLRNDLVVDEIILRVAGVEAPIDIRVNPRAYSVKSEILYREFQVKEQELVNAGNVSEARQRFVEFITPLVTRCNPGWTEDDTYALRTEDLILIHSFFAVPSAARRLVEERRKTLLIPTSPAETADSTDSTPSTPPAIKRTKAARLAA